MLFGRLRTLRLWQRLVLIGAAILVVLVIIGTLLPKRAHDLNYQTHLTDFPLVLSGVTVPAGSEIRVQCKYVYGNAAGGHEDQFYIATWQSEYFPVPAFYLSSVPSGGALGVDNQSCAKYLARHHLSPPPISSN